MSNWTYSDDYRTATLERVTDHGVFRAVIERDEYPHAPYFFAGDPILDTHESGVVVYGGEVEAGTSNPVDRIAEAGHYFGGGSDGWGLWERYVRAFHGGTVRWINGGSRGEEGRYAALALPEYRKLHGCPDEHLHDPADVSEWTAYIEGDVYGIRVEQACSFDDEDNADDWTEVPETDVWGFYGEAYAMQEAADSLEVVVRETAAAMLPLGGAA